MTENVKVGAGDVPIKLDGKTHYLKPSAGAFHAIARQYGGLVKAMDAVRALDGDCMALVVAQGLQSKSNKIGDYIYAAGPLNCMAPLLIYLSNLSNGGAPLKQDEGLGGGLGDPLETTSSSQSTSTTAES